MLTDSYFTKDGRVYCETHYAKRFAVVCFGCQNYITNEFVQTDGMEWHTNCFKLHKIWNIKLQKEDKPELSNVIVDKVLETLSNYEEGSADCISNILTHFTNSDFTKVSLKVQNFLRYIETLYFSMYSLELESEKMQEKSQISFKDAKLLSKRIIEFLSLLALKELDNKQVSKELISQVTELAYSVKTVLRGALKEASRLESAGCTDFFMQFISLLESETIFSRSGDDSLDLEGHTVCMNCKKSLDDDCWGMASKKWHSSCVKCSVCKAEDEKEFFLNGNELYCSNHLLKNGAHQIRQVSRLEQYSYLLVLSLRRFCNLVDVSYPRNIFLD